MSTEKHPINAHVENSIACPKTLDSSSKLYHQMIYQWNQTDSPYPKDKTIHQLFQEQAEKTPDHIALVFNNHHMSYKELNDRANQLAHHLRQLYHHRYGKALEGDTLVALLLDRSFDMIISILAVLKAGAAYVPISPEFPLDRINYILEDTKTGFLISQAHLSHHIESVTCKNINIIYADQCGCNDTLRHNPVSHTQSHHLAYVIYTSGTTGKPKGVMIEHRAYSIFVYSFAKSISKIDNFDLLSLTNYVFDIFGLEYTLPLLNGYKLILSSIENLSSTEIKISNIIQQTPQNIFHICRLFPGQFKNKTVIYGGEAASLKQVEVFLNEFQYLFNVYGPSETLIWSTIHETLSIDDYKKIGKPLINEKCYILNSNLAPVDIGQEGELYIAGAGLARGYLNLPKLTQEKFIPNPFASESDIQNGYTRLYKTGDICKWLENAEIEYVGRSDFQVKIRGFRIELGEIESTIALLDEIEQVCVLAKQNVSSSEKYLAAYIVFKKDRALSDEAISSFIAQKLPHYMIPSIYISLKHFPLTINGKLDRQALPEPIYEARSKIIPITTLIQEIVLKVWKDQLGLENISIDQNFFKLGGSSIAAIHVSAILSQQLHKKVHVKDLFTHSTIESLSTWIDQVTEDYVNIPITTDDPYELSFSQQRLFFIEQLEAGTNAYHIPLLIKLSQSINLSLLEKSIKAIVNRHSILRTKYRQNQNGKIIQTITTGEPKVSYHKHQNKDHLDIAIRLDINTPFDLTHELPIRIVFYTYQETHYLLLNIHHIATDGWSIDILIKELFALYQSFVDGSTLKLEHLSIEYKDFAVWQKKDMSGVKLKHQLNFWQNQLVGIESLELPLDFQRPVKFDLQGEDIFFTLDKETSDGLKRLSAQTGKTLYHITLAGFFILLHRYTQQKNIVIGTPYASRDYPQLKNIMGFFINNLILRQKINPNSCIDELVDTIVNGFIEVQNYQETPFDEIVSHVNLGKNLSQHPIFQVMFSVQKFNTSYSGDIKKYAEIINLSPFYQVAKFDLTCMMDDSQDQVIGMMNYATSLFKRNTIERFIHHYKIILSEVIQGYDTKQIKDYQLLTSQEYQTIVYDWNKTESFYPKDKTIHQLFEAQAEKTPDHIALVFNNHSMCYKELNERANQLAHHLRQLYHHRYGKALEGDTLVALLLDRSFDMIISILAVLKAGAAYVPISPEFPLDRINYILEDTKTGFLISQTHLSHHIESVTCKNINIIYADQCGCNDTLRHNPVSHTQSHHLAYVIYTSGTTGKPKGVMIEHRALMSTIHNMHSLYAHKPSKASFYSSYVFDVSIAEIFTPITLGYSLFILTENQRQDVFVLSNFLSDNKIQYTFLPPAILKILDTSKHYSFKLLMYAGESCDKKTISAWINKYVLVNLYAPSETCIYSTVKKIASANDHNCIGQIFCNEKAYILNSNLAPVDIGQEGELYIAGAGLARGYLNLPSLTQEKFIPNPFASESDIQNGYTRLYKTGDICKWLENAEIEYVGRSDFQVKIRGFRIELGEIESTIALLDDIEQVCVLAKQNISSSEKYLAAYIVFKKDRILSDEAISSFIAQKLPHYMIPSIYISLQNFPLTINGKLDRQALPEPVFQAKEDYVEPRNDLERALCRLWQDTLHVEKVGIEDDFFALGGNSILAIELSHTMSQKLSRTVQLSDLFSLKSIKKIIDHNANNTLLRILSDHSNQETKEKVYFIHPAFAGCEVYQPIVQHLSVYYQCVGIENYNLNYREKETSLAVLAAKYLKMLNFQDPNKKINLFGWSLGGLIAAEMAFQLERNGYKQISIVMLDSHINYKEKLKYHPHFNPDRGGNNVHDFVNDLTKNHSQYYRDKVLSAKEAEIKLGSSSISGQLKSTKVFLIRATKNKGYHYRYNNMNKISRYCYYVDMPVGHMDIIAELEKNWKVYKQSFQDFDFSKKLNNISRNTLKGWLILYKKRASLILSAIAGSCIVYSMELFDLLLESLEFNSIIYF